MWAKVSYHTLIICCALGRKSSREQSFSTFLNGIYRICLVLFGTGKDKDPKHRAVDSPTHWLTGHTIQILSADWWGKKGLK